MGYIGDTYGRKRALEISIFMMAFPTFLMGCLPTYDQVGSLAIVLLTLTRVLQGLSVGGQLVTSLVFTCENNPRSQWGLYGSYVMAAANFGTLLGGLMAYTMRENLTEAQLLDWGWRLPFMLGILVSFCGIYLKYYCEDDSIEQLHGAGGVSPPNPVKAAFAKGNRMMLLAASLVPMLWAGGFYLIFVWMATFMDVLVDPPVPDAFEVNSASLLFSVCLFFPLAGWLSDKFDRKMIMYIGGFAVAVFSPLMILAISQGNNVGAFFAQSFLGIALSLYGAPSKSLVSLIAGMCIIDISFCLSSHFLNSVCAFLVESFPVQMRLTCVAIGYNVAHAIVGGSSPALATYLVDKYGSTSPGYMVTAIAILSLAGLYLAPDVSAAQEWDDVNGDEIEITDASLGPAETRKKYQNTIRDVEESSGMEIKDATLGLGETGMNYQKRGIGNTTRPETDLGDLDPRYSGSVNMNTSRNILMRGRSGGHDSVVSYDDDTSDDGMSFDHSDVESTDPGMMHEEIF